MGNQRPRIVLQGYGAEAERWAHSLRSLSRLRPPSDKRSGADALVVAPGAADPFARAKEALAERVPVLYAAPFLLSPWQTRVLDELGRRQGVLLRFAEPFRHQPAFAFLGRLLRGDEPFWRPLYLRMVRTAPAGSPRRLDELAAEELALCLALLGSAPRSVTAEASRHDQVGEPCAVFLLLHQPDGPPVQCAISLVEATCCDQIVAVTAGHTIVLDEAHRAASLRILGGAGRDVESNAAPQALPATPADPLVEEARLFVEAVAAQDLSFGNSERWAQTAALWWAARQSMSFGGTMQLPLRPRDAEPPPLTVIQGGGRSASSKRERPALTLVAG